MSSKSDGSTFNTEISADPAKFEQGFQRAVSAASTGSAHINAQFKKIGEAMSGVNALFLGLTATLAGGGALKKFITDANEWNGTAGKMASQLGITTQQASVLNTALTRLGIDSDVYVGASQKLSKQVQSNAQAFDVLGIKVRDASGAYKPVTQLMGEVNQKLIEIKNPIEQNIAGQQVVRASATRACSRLPCQALRPTASSSAPTSADFSWPTLSTTASPSSTSAATATSFRMAVCSRVARTTPTRSIPAASMCW